MGTTKSGTFIAHWMTFLKIWLEKNRSRMGPMEASGCEFTSIISKLHIAER